MQSVRDLAIVLRSIVYEERHRIVTALTENYGQISVLARNSIQSRRFGGTLDPFAASEWHFTRKPGSELHRLDEAHIRRSYEGLRTDFERLSLASVFNELMLKVAPKEEACPDLFRLHSNALAVLEESTTPGADLTLLNGYLTKLLQWSGSQPQLYQCLECQTPITQIAASGAPVTAVIADAGWVCSDCRGSGTRHILERQGQSFSHSSLRISPLAILDFHMSMMVPIRQLPAQAQASRQDHRALFKFLEALFAYHLPGFDQKPLKSLRFLDLESNLSPPSPSPRPTLASH